MLSFLDIQQQNRNDLSAVKSRAKQQLHELSHHIEVAAASAREAIAQALLVLTQAQTAKTNEISPETIQSDLEWLYGLINLHRKQFELLVCRHFPRDKEMQEEIIQDTIVSALEYVKKYGRESIDKEKIPQWLRSIAKNNCLDIFNLKKKRRVLSLNQNADGSAYVPGIEAKPEVEQDKFILSERLDRKLLENSFFEYLEEMDMEKHYKQLLQNAPRRGLRYFILLWGGLTHEEVAKELGVTMNSINCAVYRFRDWMEENLKEHISGEELSGVMNDRRSLKKRKNLRIIRTFKGHNGIQNSLGKRVVK